MDSSFFYSIRDELKYSNELSLQAPTLMRGKIEHFLVSPDNTKIAVVANGSLLVVDADGSAMRKVTAVDSIYRDLSGKKGIPVGRRFFRDDNFQWSRDSQYLYLIKDEFYDAGRSQLFSAKVELWRYALQTGLLEPVIKPFPAYSYFFGLHGIYFSVPTSAGDLQLKYFDGKSIANIAEADAEIPANRLSSTFLESPFFSFSAFDYRKAVLLTEGVRLALDGNGRPEKLVIGTRTYLAITEGKGFKGPFYCSDTFSSVFAPGNGYLLFDASGCQNFDGQLLIDTVTGDYEKLPKESRIYPLLNTQNVARYKVTGGGIVP